MKKFVFRLQIVLDRALQQEEAKQLLLAQAQQLRALKEIEIERKHADRQEMLAHIAQKQQQTFDPWEMHQCHLHLSVLGNDLCTLRLQAEELDQHVLTAQQALAEAMRQRQLLEKLREKQRASYQREFEKDELKTMEEASLPRLAREHAAEVRRRSQP